MSDRTRHLAGALLAKLQALELALLDDAAPAAGEEAARRQQTIAQVLHSEEGISDPALPSLLLEAMPRLIPGEEATDRELAEFSRLLDRQLSFAP